MEAVAIGDVAGDDAADLEGHDARLLGFRTEGADDRLQWAHPLQRAGLGGAGAGAHRLRPGEIADNAGHHAGNDLVCRAAGLDDMGDVEITLLRITVYMRLGNRGEARLAQEALDRLLGC